MAQQIQVCEHLNIISIREISYQYSQQYDECFVGSMLDVLHCRLLLGVHYRIVLGRGIRRLHVIQYLCHHHEGKVCHIMIITGDPLHSRAIAHSRAPLFTQPCPHCSHSRAPGEQWARLCVFTLQGCVQAARLCRGSPVIMKAVSLQ